MKKQENSKKNILFKEFPFWVMLVFLALLPFQAFLVTFIRFKFSLSSDQAVFISLWKEYFLAMLVILGILKTLRFKKLPFKILKLDKIIFSFFVLAFLYFLFFGGNWGQKISGLRYDLEFFLVYFLARTFNFDKRKIKIFLITFLVTALLVVLFGLLQISYLPPSFLEKFGYTANPDLYLQTGILSTYGPVNPSLPNFYRIQSTFPGALQFSSYLIVISAFVFSLTLFLRDKKQYFLLLIAFLLAVFLAIFATYSRSAWLGLLAGIFTIFFIKAKKKRNVILPTVILIFLGVVTAFLFFNVQTFQTIILHGEVRENALFGSTMTHFEAFLGSITLIFKNPLGMGIGSAGPASTLGRTLITENWYFQIAIELGILGLAIFSAIIIYLFNYLKRIFQESKEILYKFLSLGLLGTLLGISVNSFLVHTWADTATAYSFWLFAGLVIASFESNLSQEEPLKVFKNFLK